MRSISTKGQVWVAPDFDAPLPEDVLAGFEKRDAAASAWEVAIKASLGRLRLPLDATAFLLPSAGIEVDQPPAQRAGPPIRVL
jgi:PIN domain nuclease of toxin-antitoxin system